MSSFKLRPFLVVVAAILGLAVATNADEISLAADFGYGDCKPNDCWMNGTCFNYYICSNGVWRNETCGSGLYWNSDAQGGMGACDYFENLASSLKDKYTTDTSCIAPCEWWQDAAQRCTGNYQFRRPFVSSQPLTAAQRTVSLTCPKAPAGSNQKDLIWNPTKLTCDMPSSVTGC